MNLCGGVCLVEGIRRCRAMSLFEEMSPCEGRGGVCVVREKHAPRNRLKLEANARIL